IDDQLVIEVRSAASKSNVSPNALPSTGPNLSLDFEDVDTRTVLQKLAEYSDRKIVVSDTVAGNVTVRIRDVPPDRAIDIVVRSKGLEARPQGDRLYLGQGEGSEELARVTSDSSEIDPLTASGNPSTSTVKQESACELIGPSPSVPKHYTVH